MFWDSFSLALLFYAVKTDDIGISAAVLVLLNWDAWLEATMGCASSTLPEFSYQEFLLAVCVLCMSINVMTLFHC